MRTDLLQVDTHLDASVSEHPFLSYGLPKLCRQAVVAHQNEMSMLRLREKPGDLIIVFRTKPILNSLLR